jgi:hypothetical protein
MVQDHSNNLSYVAVPALGWCIVVPVLFVRFARVNDLLGLVK